MKKTRPQMRYSEEFKRTVVEEIETGIMTVTQACRYYGISGAVSIYKWIAVYGMNEIKGRKVLIMSHKEENELITLRRELALLKKELEEAEIRAIAWKSMVDAIEQDLKIPVKKSPGARPYSMQGSNSIPRKALQRGKILSDLRTLQASQIQTKSGLSKESESQRDDLAQGKGIAPTA